MIHSDFYCSVWTVAHGQISLRIERSCNRIGASYRDFLDPRGESSRQPGRRGRRRRKPQGYQPSNPSRQHKREFSFRYPSITFYTYIRSVFHKLIIYLLCKCKSYKPFAFGNDHVVITRRGLFALTGNKYISCRAKNSIRRKDR